MRTCVRPARTGRRSSTTSSRTGSRTCSQASRNFEMINSMSGILEAAAAKSKKADKVQVLKDNNHVALRIMVALALNPYVEWDLPEGEIAYKPNPIEIDQEPILYNELRKFYLYLKPNHVFREYNGRIDREKKRLLFIQL